ncbi:MAG: hypothetical protein ACRDOK_28655 [Streptosporangiaceae bacterium]
MRQRARAVQKPRAAAGTVRRPDPGAARPAAIFRPSRHGFAFPNSWPPARAIAIRTPAGRVGIGNAALGLCGGMVFAALDYWRAGREPPAARPAPGAPLYRFIVRRLLQSWRLPAVARYYLGMLAADGDLAGRTISRQWPRIKALLDRGQPATLGVVTVASANPFRLGHNHQVLAYGYQQANAAVTLLVYDPNSGPDDGVAVRFSTAAPAGTFAHNIAVSWPVRGFFLTRYTPVEPPAG